MDRPLFYTRTIDSRHLIVTCLLTAVTIIATSINPQPATADTPSTCVLKWGIIDTPGSFPQRHDIQTACEINNLAISADGKYIYATDIPNASIGPVVNAGIWRSTDGGISWSLRPSKWLAQTIPAPIFPVCGIAVAPDNPDFIAAVCMDTAGTHRREIYISEDGGTNWVYSGRIPWLFGTSEQTGEIAITGSYSSRGKTVRDIIVGSRNPADGLAQGEVYNLTYPGLAGWKAQGFTGGDIITLMPSPDYPTDATIIVMSSTTQRTYINLGQRDLGGNSCSWNLPSNWPVELCTPDQVGGTDSGENKIITGSLTLPADYNWNIVDKSIIFASYDSNGASLGTSQPLDDVYRLNNTIVTRLKAPGYGSKPRICSIAYTGTAKSGKLLAGGVTADPILATATLWITRNPLDTCATWAKPLKPPTGGYGTGLANVKATWTQDGIQAITGTGSGDRDTPLKWSNPTDPSWNSQPLDESALSISLDDGMSWNQLGLIDTRINRYRSFTAGEEGTTVYIASVNDNGLDSIWRSHTSVAGDSWQRVACIDCSGPLLRPAPDKTNGSVIFLGNQGTAMVTRSTDSGQTWQDCLTGAILQDMASGGSNELYVLQANGLFRHGVFDTPGWKWEKFADTGLSPAHSITTQQNNLLVGAAAGQICPVSYSSDKGETWTLITQPALSNGNRHPAFDDEFKDNRIIYLADDAGGLYRWSIGTSNRWDDMVPPNNSYYGVATGGHGVLYAAYSPLSKGADRTIYSRAGIPKSGVSWDSLTVGLNSGVVFRLEPNSLVHSQETIWSIDARDFNPTTGVGCLWAFRDTLADHSPWLIAPKENSLVYCDPVTGRNSQVDLKWQQLSLADAYELEIAKDSWFDLIVTGAAPDTSPFYTPPDVLYPACYIGDGLLPEAGHNYYWHIRARRAATGQTIRSYWSHALSFSIRPGFRVAATSYQGIQSLSPCHEACNIPVYPVSFSWSPIQGTSRYHFMLATDPKFSNLVIDEKVENTAYKLFTRLSYKTAYFWQVTPVEPIPGDPSPVFSFTTQDMDNPPAQLASSTNHVTDALLIALIVVILCALWVQVVFFHTRRSSN
ncbi:MAG: hypothetical protein ABSA18_03825 [Dehalococcoidia bacterium]